jgi:hypothetical protein
MNKVKIITISSKGKQSAGRRSAGMVVEQTRDFCGFGRMADIGIVHGTSNQEEITVQKRKWCQRRDLNPRPKAYESSALPLSYSGTKSVFKYLGNRLGVKSNDVAVHMKQQFAKNRSDHFPAPKVRNFAYFQNQ